MTKLKLTLFVLTMLSSSIVNAVILVQTSDSGFYNDSLGTILNNTNGGNTATGYFPSSNDANVTFPLAPDLTVADSILGNWLTDPAHLNGNWSSEDSIPNSWVVNTEVAVIYQFDTLGATNVIASFGVDNGIYAWLDGNYLGGARKGGGAVLGEHVFNVGDLSAGTHFLQLLLEDHGTTNGYKVEISADTFTPAPVPVPSAVWLFASGIVGLIGRYRSRNNSL